MSTAAHLSQQLQQDLQNELTTANQLLHLISIELQQIKHFTRINGEFEENIKQNSSLVMTLANLQQVDVENLPPVTHKQIDMSRNTNNVTYEQHETFRNSSGMDDSQ
ncbi:uncharacterized protein LOC131847158 [Achroia grisella]|uniref:uncharacterized protein LOC131847158 n=1 Tax=Achroia grisella TaxID=688607 RepID=UPI0027D2DCFA|nr:uncharacterized protein LOC131847158 [Achroia grisella]